MHVNGAFCPSNTGLTSLNLPLYYFLFPLLFSS